MLRRRLTARQQELSLALAREEAANQIAQFNTNAQLVNLLRSTGNEDQLDCNDQTTAYRIQSRDAGHAILIKKSPIKRSNQPQAAKVEIDR